MILYLTFTITFIKIMIMKRNLLFIVLFFSTLPVAFSQAYETKVDYAKKKQEAFAMDYTYSQEAVENALVKKIEDLGFKSKTEKGLFNRDKGFILFKNTIISDISDQRMDYIVKIDRKSRKDKDESTLSMIINNGSQNAMATMDAFTVGKVKAFLANLQPEIAEASLELDIKAQEDMVSKAEKKYKDLQDTKADLEKKLKKNTEDIGSQEKEIESLRVALDQLKSKRRVNP